RKGDSVRPGEVLAEQGDLAVLDRENAAKRQFLSAIIKEFRQPKWWFGEVEGSVTPIDEIVRAIEALPFESICKACHRAGWFPSHHPSGGMLIDRQTTVAIKGQTIRARLTVFGDIRTFIAASFAKNS